MQNITNALLIALVNLARQITARFGKRYGSALLGMLNEWEAVEVVDILCHRAPSDMFRMLYSKGALELTVEALAIREEFASVISRRTRVAAKFRLDYFRGLDGTVAV